jgi:anti-sigma factor RsiW
MNDGVEREHVRPPAAKVSEQDLHDYVDGRLGEADRARIEAHLAHHADHREQVEIYRAVNRGLHALHDRVLAEPIPPAMKALLAKHKQS